MASGMKFDMSQMLQGLSECESKTLAAVHKYADTSAGKLESHAKVHAPWQNHTGDARRRLKGDSLPVENGFKLRLAHGVEYGIWLEVANERRFAIIEPTIRQVGSSEIMPGFNRLLDRLGGGK